MKLYSEDSATMPGDRAALVTAHPSHELKVHRWIEMAQPVAFVMADGSGYVGRTESMKATDRVLLKAGAQPGAMYGAIPERAAYVALLQFDHGFFCNLAEELATALVRDRIDYVVGDAAEACILIHDLARMVIDTALERVRQMTGQRIPSYDYLLEGMPDQCPDELRSQSIWLDLDDEAFQRKTEAAKAWADETDIKKEIDLFLGKKDVAPEVVAPREILLKLGDNALHRKLEAAKIYREFAVEINKAIEGGDLTPYRAECLRPVTAWHQPVAEGQKPVYETYGEKLVAAGFYKEVIRHRDHILPLEGALKAYLAKHEVQRRAA